MQLWHGAIIAISLMLTAGVSGCLDRTTEKTVILTTPTTPLPMITPVPENPIAEDSPSMLALQLADLPPDYFMRSRSVVAFEEIPSINRALGWRQGYYVSFYRMNLQHEDLTGITQTTGIYPLENMNKVFAIENDTLLAQDFSVERHEIPFPTIGDRSVAVRESSLDNRFNVDTYTVIFVRKNVFEKISMSGTTTDYEVLKDVVMKAEAKVR
jgi:hypothetical protein